MRVVRIAVVTFIALAIIMYVSNPNDEDFKAWMGAHVEQKFENEDSGLIGGALNSALAELVTQIGSQATERKDYQLFSIYEVDMGKTEYHYLGMLHFFVPLQSENPLDDWNTSND